jgi:NTP pyrophosphatase (non-canonical NTP hydrolase)
MTVTNKEYMEFTRTTRKYDSEFPLDYLIPGICAETGELAGVVAKLLRKYHHFTSDSLTFMGDQFYSDGEGEALTSIKREFIYELGDILWMLTSIVDEIGCTIEDIMELNMEKLQGRKDRGELVDHD